MECGDIKCSSRFLRHMEILDLNAGPKSMPTS